MNKISILPGAAMALFSISVLACDGYSEISFKETMYRYERNVKPKQISNTVMYAWMDKTYGKQHWQIGVVKSAKLTHNYIPALQLQQHNPGQKLIVLQQITYLRNRDRSADTINLLANYTLIEPNVKEIKLGGDLVSVFYNTQTNLWLIEESITADGRKRVVLDDNPWIYYVTNCAYGMEIVSQDRDGSKVRRKRQRQK
ncbi:MAG: hypothetical protein OEZ39_16530 [Gammaproteobacteria bacterium]|nr:hypothetical protein [Gammaproteobacteria bacterium]MDH5653467.1 hypothetical protein [Gammaproteobacteria bacterium]